MMKQRSSIFRDVTKLLFVPLATDICEQPMRLLLDTGADVTGIKEESSLQQCKKRLICDDDVSLSK